MARLLVADDQPDIREALRLLLKAEGHTVTTVGSPQEAKQALAAAAFDLALIDLNYTRDTPSGREGLDLRAEILANDPHLPVVVLTAWASLEVAVGAMRRGARDFVEKPWENARLLAIVARELALGTALAQGRRLEAENRSLRGAPAASALVARSPAMAQVLDAVERVAGSAANVLLTGENGTGKGLVAEILHQRSARAAGPLVTVDTGALPESVFESELFGHVRGAFTDAKSERMGRFELADGGTLFLDEIANLAPHQQAKLLRAVESGEISPIGSTRPRRVDVRILSATNAELETEVAAGRFRRDLFFRLNTVTLRLPPLRERREDLLPLAGMFLARHRERYRREILDFAPDARAALLAHPWPGNVRELDHAVERAVLFARGPVIAVEDLGLGLPTAASSASPGTLEELTLEEVERLLVKKALERHGGNVTEAARSLGLSRSALYRRLEKHDV
ncbi:MAG: sigma-54 dependent transcriptional regulator [Thermoanaerobaculia bacterium]|nr:sigma-54 dependent transcriptional regulator [Thermoanaerobaculia bacterium]